MSLNTDKLNGVDFTPTPRHEYAIEYPSNVAKAITENYKNVKKDSARLDWILSQLDYDVKMNLGITGTRESIDKMMA